MSDAENVCVIGSGVAGLSCALALASRGARVTVLEAAQELGGKAGRFISDGVEFDTGPSVLTLPEVFDDLFRLGGSSLGEEVSLRRPEPGFRYLYPNGTTLDVHFSLEETFSSVESVLGKKARDELASYLEDAGRIWAAAAPAFVRAPAPSVARIFRGGPRSWLDLLSIDAFRTMDEAILRRVKTPELVTLLRRYATYNGSDVRRAPATLGCIAHVELALGGYGVEGGIYELVRALVRRAERLGVRFETGTRAERIVVAAGRVRAVRVGGVERPFAAVFACTEVRHLTETLLPEIAVGRDGEESCASTSGWTGVFRARRFCAPPRVAHTVVFPNDYLEEFRALFDRREIPAQPTLYLCAQEACHGRRGWLEEEPVFVMMNAPAVFGSGEGDYGELHEQARRRLIELGLLETTDSLVWSRTPKELSERFPGSHGALYGPASNDKWSAFRRLQSRLPKVSGAYFAHGSGHPGGGLPLVAQAGLLAADAWAEDLGERR